GKDPKVPPLDGEAALIVRSARRSHERAQALSRVGSECQKRFAHLTGEEALACAILSWDDPDRSWLEAAAKVVPGGPAGAPVRADNDRRILLGARRPDAAGRADLLAHYRKQLEQMPAPHERRALWLLGNTAAAEHPLQWVPAAPEEQKELQALDQNAPCDA